MSNGTIKNAPEVQAFIDVIWTKAEMAEDNVSTRIAQSLVRQPNWPPRNLETHRQIIAYQRQLTSQYKGKINRGGLGHLWSEAYKRTEEPVQIDIEEQIAAQAEEKAAADMGYKHYSSAEKNTIKKMFADGATDEQIAKKLGRTTNAILLKRLEMKLYSDRKMQWSESEHLMLEALLNKGYSYEKIAVEMGRTYHSIRGKVRSLQLAAKEQPAPPSAPTPPPTPAPAPTKPKSWWRRLFG